MKTFREYVREEVASTKRQNMIHLQKMPDVEFIMFVQHLKRTVGGRLDDLKVSIKCDGGSGRFGIAADGRPFFEGSRTGPIFEPKAFSSHAIAKGSGPEIITRAYHYDDMWETVTKSKFIKVLPKDSKVVCELFYNPMAEITDAGIKFVSVAYDKNKLGSLMTLIPFEVLVASTGETHPQSEQLIQKLLGQSTSEIKIISPKLSVKGTLDLSGMIDPIMAMGPDTVATLTSRKKVDAPAKAALKAILQSVKDAVGQYILEHPAIVGKDMLGPDIEGLVLTINGRDVKVTTPEFKASKSKEKQ
jgi:hypothetical protein